MLASAVCTANYSLLIVRLSGSKNARSLPSFPTFQLFLLFMENALCSAERVQQRDSVHSFSIVSRVFEYCSPGCLSPPLVRWAPFEVLQYQNRANSLKRNMRGLFLHVLKTPVNHTWTKDENKTQSAYVCVSFGKSWISALRFFGPQYKALCSSVTYIFHNCTCKWKHLNSWISRVILWLFVRVVFPAKRMPDNSSISLFFSFKSSVTIAHTSWKLLRQRASMKLMSYWLFTPRHNPL